jgi:hypothetical protein
LELSPRLERCWIADTEPDLFWALRGGGGGFALVSAIELDLVELAEVYAGAVIYPADDRSRETPAISDTTSLEAMPGEAIDAFVETAGPDAGSPLVNAELRHLGGALAAPLDGGGARSHLDAAVIFTGTGVPRDPSLAAPIHRQIDKIRDALAPWSKGPRLSNFAGRPTSPELLFDADTLARLREAKRRHDPDGLIEANLPLHA